MRRATILLPLIILFGGTAGRSFVEFDGVSIRCKFGWLFDHSFPIEQVERVTRSRWPWYGGIGWRADFRGTVGLVASYDGIVEIRLATKHRVKMIVPRLPCNRVFISLESPDEFVHAVGKALHERTAQMDTP
jgi:hypothetical protein